MRFMLLLLTLAVSAPGCRQEQSANEDKADKERLQGTWNVIDMVVNGKPATKDVLAAYQATFAFASDKMTSVSAPGGRREHTYQLDTAKNPRTIDAKALDGPRQGKTDLGIYHLQGDTLRLCLPIESDKAQRPTEIASKDGSNLVLFTLKRAQPPLK